MIPVDIGRKSLHTVPCDWHRPTEIGEMCKRNGMVCYPLKGTWQNHDFKKGGQPRLKVCGEDWILTTVTDW
jgi:hypothetical protein